MNGRSGRVAWIVGGGSGIGAALARSLAERGWTVAISGRREHALSEIAAGNSAIHSYPLDATQTEDVRTACERIASERGRIDLFVYGAAAWQPMQPGEYAFDRFHAIVDTNLLGAVRALDPVVAHMRQNGGGQLALVASVAGYFGLPRAAAYGATKAALIYLAETLHIELEKDGIDVRVVNPGFVATDLTAKNDFPMPFLMTAEDAGDRIAAGLLDTRRFEIAFPWQMALGMKALRLLPSSLRFRLVRRTLSKGRTE